MSKVVLVTGASSGIGKSIATFLSKKGYKVYGTSREPKNKDEFCYEMIVLDVLKIDTIKKAVGFIIKKEDRIDVLVNNAGMGITGAIEDTPTEEMKAVFNTNFFGYVDLMKEVLPKMREQKFGIIINITSIAGYMGLPFRGIYSATKSAIEMMSEAANMEVKNFGIKVVNIAPGDISTDIASKRYNTPMLKNSAYKEMYKKSLILIDEHTNSGLNPLKVAKKVYKILNSKNPKIHYKVGSFIQKFSIILKRILPDRLYEKMLMKHYNI